MQNPSYTLSPRMEKHQKLLEEQLKKVEEIPNSLTCPLCFCKIPTFAGYQHIKFSCLLDFEKKWDMPQSIPTKPNVQKRARMVDGSENVKNKKSLREKNDCSLGEELCPLDSRQPSRKGVTITDGKLSFYICKWRHFKTPAVLQWLKKQDLKPQKCIDETEEEEVTCSACNIDLNGHDIIELYSKGRSTVYNFCNVDCVLTFVQQVKQKQWEFAVSENRLVRLSG